MRSIPQALLDKINNSFQSKGTNSNPRMDIIAQKATKYLTEGSLLQAKTVRTGNDLGALDICIRREDVNLDPSEIVMAYIENGLAKVATLPYVHTPNQLFTYQYTIGPATDVACDFDGRWHKITERTGIYFDTAIRWALVTFGEPYISTVNNGVLTVRQGQESATTLAPDNVTKVAMLRGWKNVAQWNHDQGIVVAYIRNNSIHYRNYSNQPPDQPAIWEIEREVILPTPAQNVGLFRTNDYRLGFLCESNGIIHWTITDRNWANMAIEDHTISATGTGLSVVFTEITEHEFALDHTVSATSTDLSAKICPAIWPQFIGIENIDQYTILIECDLPLYGNLTGLQSAFTIKDASNIFFAVTATIKTSERFIELSVSNFESASGDLTITYNALLPIYSQVDGGCLMELSGFTESFTPDIEPPQTFSEHTLNIHGTELLVSLKEIVYTSIQDDSDNHIVSATGTDLTVTLIDIADINP